MEKWRIAAGVTNVIPNEQLFTMLVEDALDNMAGSNSVEFAAHVFALGEKFAEFRTRFSAPDPKSLAELKAIYWILTEEYEQRFFLRHAEKDYFALKESVVDTAALQKNLRDTASTPPDVQVMIDIYNAVWNIHYQAFLNDPAQIMSDWDINDPFQTRAMRAVFFDIAFDKFLTLCHMAVDACDDTGLARLNRKLSRSLQKKRQQIIDVLAHRSEMPKTLAQKIAGANVSEQKNIIRQMISAGVSAKVEGNKETLFGQVVPFIRPAGPRRTRKDT